MRLAACYRSISAVYRNALQQSGVALVDLDTMHNVTEIFNAFDRLRMEGRYLALMIDAPFASRRRYPFLGLDVTVSSMPWLYAKSAAPRYCLWRAIWFPKTFSVTTRARRSKTYKQTGRATCLDFCKALSSISRSNTPGRQIPFCCPICDAREAAFSFVSEVLDWRALKDRHRT